MADRIVQLVDQEDNNIYPVPPLGMASFVLNQCKEYRTTLTTTTGNVQTKTYTASGAGIVFASASCHTDMTSDTGRTAAFVARNGNVLAFDADRTSTAVNQDVGASASAAFIVKEGDVVTCNGQSSKSGTKTIDFCVLAFGSTLTVS